MKSILLRSLCAVLIPCACASSLAAQGSAKANPGQTQDAQLDPPAPPAVNPVPSSSPDTQPTGDLLEPPKRMFGMIPDFENTNDTPANRRPLTTGEKYKLSLRQAFDISAHLGNAFQAALQQASDAQPNYGESWAAYGKRFAASEGDQISGSILIYGVLPSLLHEDPRYFRRGSVRPGGRDWSAFSRMWYAASRTVVTRKDNGTPSINNSEIFGQLFSSSISTSYYPEEDRTASHVFCNWLVNLGGNSAYNVLSEFYPDMKHLLFHHHRKPVVQDGNGSAGVPN